MGKGQEDLRLKVTADGAEKAAQDVEKVSKAQKGLTETVDQSAAKTKKQTKATDDGAAALSDYAAALDRVIPGAGAWLTSLDSGINVLGDLSQKQVNLSAITEKGAELFSRYGGAIKLAGAAGVALAGFKFLADTLKDIEENAERAIASIKGVRDAQSSLEERAGARAEDVVSERDRSKRLDPFTADQAASVKETLRATPESLQSQLAAILAQFGGGQGIGPKGGGGAFTGGELTSLAQLGFEPNAEQSGNFNERSARRFLERNKDRRGAISQRDRQQSESLNRRAVTDALSSDGVESEAGLNRIVNDQSESLGVSPDIIRQIVKEEVERRKGSLKKAFATGGGSRDAFLGQARQPIAGRVDDTTFRIPFIGQDTIRRPQVRDQGAEEDRGADPAEIAAADNIVRRLQPALEEAIRKAVGDSGGTGTKGAPTTVNNNYFNQKVSAPNSGRALFGKNSVEQRGAEG